MANRSKKEKRPIALKSRPRRGKKKIQSAWDILAPLAGTLKGCGPFVRDKSERDLSKYLRKKPRGKTYLNLEKLPIGDEEGEYTPEFRRGLLKARQDLKRNKIVSHETIKRKIAHK